MPTANITSNLGTNLEKLSREKLIIAIKEIANKNIFIEAEVEKIVDKILQDENNAAKNKTQNNNVFTTSCTLFPDATISRISSPNEKIALFKNLFRGRDDVFALRWQNEKGQNGYSPVCKNKWVQGKCNIKKVPCAVCAFRELENLNDERIFNHLAGRDALCRDVLGIYPLLQNDKCNFLAIDFDEKDFKADALSVKKVCDENKIPCALEISRSGNGCHLWIFFVEEILAKLARTLGSFLLQNAMQKNHAIKFSSFDRMFPNQDFMPKGGFGNLIALPLQGNAVRQNKSVFVDDDFLPYADQWNFLSHIEKCRISENDIKQFIKILGNTIVISTGTTAESEMWLEMEQSRLLYKDCFKSDASKQNRNDIFVGHSARNDIGIITTTATDFASPVKITLSSCTLIQKSGNSEKALSVLRQLAVFSNPEFYKAQKMRLSTWNKPRFIDCSDENDENLILPRGVLSDALEIIKNAGAAAKIFDKRNKIVKIGAEFFGMLRDEQNSALDEILQNENGVFVAPPGFGKTVVASAVIAKRKVSTLIIVHTHALLKQWQNAIQKFLKIDAGEISSAKNSATSIVDVAMIQSLKNPENFLYTQIICDECHHIGAFTFENALKKINARYILGLTATPVRRDGHEKIIFMQCGKIVFDASAKIKNENRYFVSRFTPFFVLNAENSEIQIQDYYKELVENSSRNALIADDVRAVVNAGLIPLVLSERVSHIEELARRLENAAKNVIVITGRGTAKQKKATLEELSAVQKNETLIVLATGKYIGEGFDDNRFDTLFLAMPISWCSNRRCVEKKSATADFFSIFKKMAHCETCEQGGARLNNIVGGYVEMQQTNRH